MLLCISPGGFHMKLDCAMTPFGLTARAAPGVALTYTKSADIGFWLPSVHVNNCRQPGRLKTSPYFVQSPSHPHPPVPPRAPYKKDKYFKFESLVVFFLMHYLKFIYLRAAILGLACLQSTFNEIKFAIQPKNSHYFKHTQYHSHVTTNRVKINDILCSLTYITRSSFKNIIITHDWRN